MSKSHREVMAGFKTQSNTLSQMAESFPDHAAHAASMLEKLRVIESCVLQAAEKIEWIQIGVAELQEMKKGQLTSLTWTSHTNTNSLPIRRPRGIL